MSNICDFKYLIRTSTRALRFKQYLIYQYNEKIKIWLSYVCNTVWILSNQTLITITWGKKLMHNNIFLKFWYEINTKWLITWSYPSLFCTRGQNTKIGAKSFNCDNGCWGSDAMITNSVEVAIIHVTALWTSIYITVIFEELRDFLRDFFAWCIDSAWNLRDVSLIKLM